MSESPVGQSLWTGPRGDHRRYRVDLDAGALQSVGDGGEGLVYRAVREADGRDVALKMLTTLTLDDYPRVEQRGALLGEIDDPHVMHQLETFIGTALLDTTTPDDNDFEVIYTVADWVPGVPLETAMRDTEPATGLAWVGQIARGVAALHNFRSPEAPDGIVHRDIKPSNVRITPDHQAVLIDFGIARPHDTSDFTQGAGTYLWRAPEVVGGPGTPGPASDAWGVGALAYWTLLGEPPRLEGATAARERLTPAAHDAALPDPTGIATHIAQLLETHPDQRPSDLNKWATELGRYRTKRSRRRTKRLALMAAAAAIIVAAVGVSAWALTTQDRANGHNAASSRATTQPPTTATTIPATTTTTIPPTTTTIGPTALVAQLQAGVQLDTYQQLLGAAQVRNNDGALTENLWIRPEMYVQAYSDANDKVLAYSVTTRTPDFQPTFGWCGLGNVTLGKTTFADVAQFSESGGPIIAAYANYALHDGTRYSEFYGRVGACNYVNYVMTANSSGLLDAAPDDYTLDGLVPNSGVAVFGAGLADVPPLPGQLGPGMGIPGAPQSDGRPLDYFTQTFIPGRSNLLVNTITVTAPNFDFFKDHPEFVVTGAAPFGPRQQELPVGSTATSGAAP